MAMSNLGPIINAERTLDYLREKLNADMLAAAEPMIVESLAAIEKEMRQKLAANLVALVEGEIQLYKGPNNMELRITLDPRKGDPRHG